MIEPTLLMTYALIVLRFVFIPGPATLLTVARATTSGTRVGIATGAGITAGDFLHTLMAVVGISAIIAASHVVRAGEISGRGVPRLPWPARDL